VVCGGSGGVFLGCVQCGSGGGVWCEGVCVGIMCVVGVHRTECPLNA